MLGTDASTCIKYVATEYALTYPTSHYRVINDWVWNWVEDVTEYSGAESEVLLLIETLSAAFPPETGSTQDPILQQGRWVFSEHSMPLLLIFWEPRRVHGQYTLKTYHVSQ